jgi:6-phosphogluconolactonase
MTASGGGRVREYLFDDADRLAETLAALVAARLRAGLRERGTASFVTAGGRTPAPFLTRLAAADLAWERVAVTLTDERWVGPDDPASNAASVQATLLTGRAATARFLPLYTGASTPEAGAAAAEARLAAIPRPYDIVLLGLGEDGHTASLFLGGDNLRAALALDSGRLCMAMRAPGAPQPRITLTLPALLDAGSLCILFTGAAKRRAFDAARSDGPVEAMPVRAVLRNASVPVEVFAV